MKANLNRVALTFGRPVLGIHNRTSGIVFDIVECLVQRNYGYATTDIRVAFKTVKDVLYNPQKSKVVFVLHSQGGIEGSLVLDWLLQELPQDLLAKLEVYTFGNAANHFNNPHRHALSQTLNSQKYLDAVATIMNKTSQDSNDDDDEKRSLKVDIPPLTNPPTRPSPSPAPPRPQRTAPSATSSTTRTAPTSSPCGGSCTLARTACARRSCRASSAACSRAPTVAAGTS